MKLKRRILSVIMALALCVGACPTWALAEESVSNPCTHHREHTPDCGYRDMAKGSPCTFVCGICNGGTEETPEDETDGNEIKDGDSENPGTENGDEIKEPDDGQEECICEERCTEDSIHMDCPVCGVENAGLSDCKGKDAEDSTEDAEENTRQPEDTGLCKHHRAHDDTCGYLPESEDSVGSPCTYACRICPIEELIVALPDAADITEDNAEEVRVQLEEILALYRELTGEEQEQIDLSHVYELQGALDGANDPALAEGHAGQQTTDEASVTIGAETLYYATLEEAFAAANGKNATITMLTNAECVKSGSAGSPLNINGGTVTLNLNGKNLSGDGYGMQYYGIVDVSGGFLLVEGEGNVNVKGKGLSCRGSGKLTVEGITLDLVGEGDFIANTGVVNMGGTVILNNVKMTGAASEGQIYHRSGNTTINYADMTGTTDGNVSVLYYEKGTLTINGGTFSNITVEENDFVKVKSVAELLGKGCAFRHQDGAWATDEEMAGRTLDNVTVQKIPLTINPQSETSWYYNSSPHTLAMNAAPVDSGVVSYEWKNGTDTLDCTTDNYEIPADMPVGNYTYTCEATYDGYTLSHVFAFEIKQSGTTLDGTVKTYKDDVAYSDFTADDTITVKATPTATGKAPVKVAARVRDYTAPDAGQMAVFVGNNQVSEAVNAGADGSYTMTVNATAVLTNGQAGQDNKYTLIVRFAENTNMAGAEIPVEVTVTPHPLTEDMVSLSEAAAVYDGYEHKPVVTVDGLDEGTDYEIAYSSQDFTNTGTVAITVTGKGKYAGTVEKTFTVEKATLRANGTGVAKGIYGAKLSELTVDGNLVVRNVKNGVEVPGWWTLTGDAIPNVGDSGEYTATFTPSTGAENYNLLTVQVKLEIARLDTQITVGTDIYDKIFGDAVFLLDVTDNNPEADVRYKVTAGTEVVSVEGGTVTIHAAGSATITVSLPESTNYNAAENKTITVNVGKKDGYTVETLSRSYLCSRENRDSIDLAALLPKDCGTVAYGTPQYRKDWVYSTAPVVTDGKLSYTVGIGSINAEDSITVIVTTRNYADITITIKVKLTDRIPVELKEGTEVTLAGNILTYGESLSKLEFNNAVFVDGAGNTVEGALAWKEATTRPNAGTTSAVWVFTPTDQTYASVEGTAMITVNRAVPAVSAVPTVAGRVYNPLRALGKSDLAGGTVGGVDGMKLAGEWSWQSADIVPTVNNSGYVAVFTPTDITNYETVTRNITVTVEKATPYIAMTPAAAGITYGEGLKDSLLTGGTVQYGNGVGQAGNGDGSTATVTGTFTWKEPSTKPTAADSNMTEYTVIFTPSDTAEYHPVETKVKLTVNKAQNAPNMPGGAMDVSNSIEKAGDVPLPEGWEWRASDRDIALEVGVTVNAVAIYSGADKGNYEKETVTVAITRSACDHATGNVLYTGAGEKAPTCTEDGSGHRECAKCGAVTESGIIVKALGHTGGTATCSGRAVCTRCGRPYGGTVGGIHGNIEVRGNKAATCTAGGYTGDTYCKDCGAKTKAGNATPALGHDYTNTVTKEPTTGSEGIRTYTCSRCGLKFTESIPKLPEETHRHSYTENVTKQPTCTDTGVRIHTCACGDSYTETIAALGHHYQSSETRKPTAGAEGVMTYTCDRCGHSYTRPIAKLSGEGITGSGPGRPGETGPGGGNAEETGTEPGRPFIKGEDGKIGWDVIRAEEEQAEEGSTINVDMNGSTVVPGDIFDSIKGRDITVTFDMGNGILWSVDGKSITGDASPDRAGDIDFSVKAGVNTVPADIVNNVTGERYSLQISLAYEGDFGFTAVLFIGLGKENAGYMASLYYYNESTGKLVFICANEVSADGTVSLAFTHASDYVIAIDKDEEEESGGAEPAQSETPGGGGVVEAGADKSPRTGLPWRIVVFGMLLVAVGAGVFFIARRKKARENE